MLSLCWLDGALVADPSATPWTNVTGDYYAGDGLGSNCTLKLEETGTFSYEAQGCLGVYGRNHGSASLRDGMVQLSPLVQEEKGTEMAKSFLAVPWGKRVYLIPENAMIDFCSAVNQGEEPRQDSHGEYYLRREQWKQRVTGKPDVPPAFQKYLLKKAVTARITELAGKQEAWINVGSREGLQPQMTLRAQDHGETMSSQVEVQAVEDHRSRIKCKYDSDELAVGQKVLSRSQR